ncbi:MAG: 1-deoxy-D-xylulose-5-phosphate synthase [Gemmatimonadales bacterium]|nr:1-deoxy-D-xylulose-5-phosphate synthase [Gemmatimonadales bacterium]MDQ3426237.1 1-deoxy-D-xylulose-5-phosphate synthase [Gemmatimonadota bacterium]
MTLLSTIHSPSDLKRLRREQLPQLAQEIRDRLIECCSLTGGHIGASLGVVELSIALLYEFDSPQDKIVWDVGHQAYAWKLLTGRNGSFPTLRQREGISGFLKRSESEHDAFGAGHAGTAVSAALGMATARDLKSESHKVVAVLGDGALTCGLSYEGMNNAGHSDRDIILILNDNGMSISPNVGAVSKTLGRIVADPRTNRVREKIKGMTFALGGVLGEGVVDFARNVEESVKNLFSPGMLFEELGFRYFGPIDGHDLPKLCETLHFVRGMGGPRVIHVMTQKGKGFAFAEDNREKWHGLAAYDPLTGEARKKASGPPTWTQVFGDGVTALGREHPELVVITAAMPSGTGANLFQKKYPERFFDVGIAEGHAVTFAGGLATQGIRPVVAIYSTFLQRAYDNVIHDVAVQRLPVTFCMDRAGLVGEDGQTHMGLYDIAYMLAVPGMTVTAPKDGDELIGLLRTAMAHDDGPFCTRYPRDKTPAEPRPVGEIPAVPYGTWERLRVGKDVAILAVGTMVAPAVEAADLLSAQGIECSVVNCRFLKPLDSAMLQSMVRQHRTVVTVEEGTIVNGFGAYLAETLQTTHPEVRVVALGVPDRLIEQAPRAEQLELFGLTAAGIARRIAALQHEESLEAR